jgi:antirestriction protein ArdC
VPEVVKIDGKKAKALVRGALDTLREALRAGESEALKTYLRAMSRFRRYSLGNILLIARACPHATRVAGFQAWRRLGRWVRKGERGIVILAPIVRRPGIRAEHAQDRDPDDDLVEARTSICDRAVGFKAAYVFDISQTEGKPMAAFSQVAGDPGQCLDRLKQFAAARNIQVRYADFMGGADGASHGGVVSIRRGLSTAAELSTLAHELAHEVLHFDKQSRPRRIQETEAEAVAFIVCEAIGVESRDASADYIQTWDGKAETLLASLNRVRDAALAIIGALDVGEQLGGGGSLIGRRTATRAVMPEVVENDKARGECGCR